MSNREDFILGDEIEKLIRAGCIDNENVTASVKKKRKPNETSSLKRKKEKYYKGIRKLQTKNDDGERRNCCEKIVKTLKPPCSCRLSGKDTAVQCRLVTDELREKLHREFWSLSWAEKKILVRKYVDCSRTHRARGRLDVDSSRRCHSFRYYIPIDNDKVHVCKKMFLNTFSLGEWSVRAWKIGNRGRLQGHVMDQESKSESSSRRSSYDHCEDNHRILVESEDIKVT